MGVGEVERRIAYFNKTKKAIKSVELRNFVSIMHLAISAGSNPSKKNNKMFHQQLDKIFNESHEESDDDLDDIMGLVNVKK